MSSFQVVYLTGPPASGKSTLATKLQNKLPDIKIYSYGTLLTERISQKHGTKYRQDDIREQSGKVITSSDVRELDADLIKKVSRDRQKHHVIIDSHPVTKEVYGFRAIPFSIQTLKEINPTMILSLFASPEIIIERIAKDSAGRPQVTEDNALMHNYLQGSVAITYSTTLGVPVYFLDSDKAPKEILGEALTVITNN